MKQTNTSKLVNLFFTFILFLSLILLPLKVGAVSNTKIKIDQTKDYRNGLESNIWQNQVSYQVLWWRVYTNDFDFEVSSWFYLNHNLSETNKISCSYVLDVNSGSVSNSTQVGVSQAGVSEVFSNEVSQNIGGEDYHIFWENNNGASSCSLDGNYTMSTVQNGYKAMNISIVEPANKGRTLIANSAIVRN